MDSKVKTYSFVAALASVAGLVVGSAHAHHSFAMYNMSETQVFTGVVDGIDPAPNHLSINFAVMNEERNNVIRDENGEPIFWSVEMGGSAQMARQGVSVNSFPRGTVFSVALHPLRNGEPGGSREGAMFRCPDNVRPEPGEHCDSVEGHVAIGNGELPEPSKD
jgi:hypothetical protein